MNTIKRVLVGLDLSKLDDIIISYVSYLNEIIDFDKIYFYHVAKSLELPEEILDKYPELLAPADETLEEIIADKVKRFYKGKAEAIIEVVEGNAEEKMLRWAKIKEIDLIVLGEKSTIRGSGLLPNKLAKHGPCSILVVPETAEEKMSRVMVAVDFSSPSKSALGRALKILARTDAHLLLQNTYVVPAGYSRIGKTYDEFAEIIKGHAEKESNALRNEYSLNDDICTTILSLDEDDDPSDKIYRDAEAHKADLLIISSKGRSGLGNLLIGSIADKLLQRKGLVPVLVLKNKNENMGFLDALFRI